MHWHKLFPSPLQVNRIVDHLLQCVYRSDFASLQGFWIHLNKRFFSRLTSDSLNTAYRLETNILRLFLVHASKQGRQDEIKAFYEKMSDALHDRKEWKDWFGECVCTAHFIGMLQLMKSSLEEFPSGHYFKY